MLATDGVDRSFSSDGLEAIADAAWQLNQTTQNIGARRLCTILERLVEELSFDRPDLHGKSLTIDAAYKLDAILQDGRPGRRPRPRDHASCAPSNKLTHGSSRGPSRSHTAYWLGPHSDTPACSPRAFIK